MLKIKTNLQSKDTFQNLGQIIVELTEVDYDRIVAYILPIAFEGIYKNLNKQNNQDASSTSYYKKEQTMDPLVKSLLEVFYQEKNLSMEAVKAAIAVFPASLKEKLIRIVLRNPLLQEKVRQVLIPYGFCFGTIEVLEDTGETV